jgi:hypothetical protein
MSVEPDNPNIPQAQPRPKPAPDPRAPVPALRLAARGVALVFVAAALQYVAVAAGMVVNHEVLRLVEIPPPAPVVPEPGAGDEQPAPTLPSGPRYEPALNPCWLLMPALIWTLASLAELAGRLNCRKVGASVRAKRLLGVCILLSVLALLFNLALGTLFVLDVTGSFPLDKLGTRNAVWILTQLPWLSLPLALLSTTLFLLYLRGMAQANELSEFVRDPIELIALALIVYLLLIPLVWVALLLIVFAMGGTLLFLGTGVGLIVGAMIGSFVLMLWPFVRYCGMLLRLRETLLRQVARQADPLRKHDWPS